MCQIFKPCACAVERTEHSPSLRKQSLVWVLNPQQPACRQGSLGLDRNLHPGESTRSPSRPESWCLSVRASWEGGFPSRLDVTDGSVCPPTPLWHTEVSDPLLFRVLFRIRMKVRTRWFCLFHLTRLQSWTESGKVGARAGADPARVDAAVQTSIGTCVI